jgi:hypothetical protein
MTHAFAAATHLTFPFHQFQPRLRGLDGAYLASEGNTYRWGVARGAHAQSDCRVLVSRDIA